MKVLDSEDLLAGIEHTVQGITQLKDQSEKIQKNIEELVALEESFKGEGGQSIRSFYNEVHLPFLRYWKTTMDQYDDVLKQIVQSLQSFEPAPQAVIRQSFIDHEVTQGLHNAEQTTRDLTDEGNSIIQSVSDIVALPQLDDSRFMDQVKLAENHKEETIDDLHSFDRSETNRLLPIEQEVATLRRIVNEMNGMFQAGELSLTQYQPNQLTNKLAASMSISQLGSFLSHGISSVPDGEEADENVNSCAAPEVETEDVEEGNDTGKELGSVALDFIPIVSNFKSGAEALMGKDLITGRELAGWERGVLVAGIFGGPIVKGAKRVVQWGGDLFGKVKNVLNPDRVKETFDLIYKKTTKAYDTFRNSAAALMKKIGDIEILTPSFAYAGGVKGNSTTVAEGLKQAKDTIVGMAGKVKDGVERVTSGTGNIKKVHGVKEYIKDVERITGRKIPDNQKELLKKKLREVDYSKKLPKEEVIKHRQDFQSKKDKLIDEWEKNTGQKWPTYTEPVLSKRGRVYIDIGDRYDAHHLIKNEYGGPNEWYNIHPAKRPDEHQGGIHRKDGPEKNLFK